VPGRSTRSLDDVVLPALQTALDDPSPRKLIVVHVGFHSRLNSQARQINKLRGSEFRTPEAASH
jgi:hypothetical protein